MQSTSKVLIDKNFSLQTFYQDLNFQKTNGKCVTHKQISDRKIVLNNSVGQNLSYYHAQITIFSRKLVLSAIFKIFVKQWENEDFWM